MQHDYALKKLIFDPLTPSLESGGGGGAGGGGGLRQNSCYHVAAFLILFNFICIMTMF